MERRAAVDGGKGSLEGFGVRVAQLVGGSVAVLCCAAVCCAGQEGERASVTRAVGVEGGFLSCCGGCEWARRPMRSCDVGPVGSSSVLIQVLS